MIAFKQAVIIQYNPPHLYIYHKQVQYTLYLNIMIYMTQKNSEIISDQTQEN